MNYRPDIDGLRTIAVVPVVLFHANVAGFTGGFIGVDIFFVISGFLITTIIHRELVEGRFSILRFYERRARRILPALFAVVLAGLVAGWVTLAPTDYDKMGQSILSALLFVLLSLEALSLLIGSVLLFFALAGTMYATRNVDWQGIGRATGEEFRP